MTHLWVRAESRPNEDRVGITPDGVAALIGQGMRVTVEDSPRRIIPTEAYAKAGATIAPEAAGPPRPTMPSSSASRSCPRAAPPCAIAT